MNNLQCPNCGGYRTCYAKMSPFPSGCFLGWKLWGLIAFGVAGWIAGPLSNLPLGLIVGLALFIGGVALSIYMSNFQPKKNLLRCDLCGYQWDENTIDRLKPIKVRQDLIEIGEQRLEQERRRRLD